MNDRSVQQTSSGRYVSRLMAIALTLLLAAALAAPALAQVFTGGPNSDFIVGTREDDTIFGLAGDDALKGLAGDDTIYGNTGKDFLVGSTGDDTFYPGADNFRDDVRCGPGEDTVYANKFDHSRNNIPKSCEHVETIKEDPPEANPTQ